MVSETALAWLAGIIDGEGCIYGHWVNRYRNKTGGNVCIEIRVEVTSLAMITKIADICREIPVFCTVDFHRWQPKATRHSHRVNIRRQREVVKFLKAIRPYLVVKCAEADAAISWYEKWGDQRNPGKPRATYGEKVVLFDSLRQMKKTS